MFFRIIRLLLNILPTILLLPIWLMLLLALKCKQAIKNKEKKETTLLHISGSSSRDHVLQKFGSLDFLFNYDGNSTEGVFTRNVIFWFPVEKTIHVDFDNNWTIIQHKLCCRNFFVVELLYVTLKIINKSIDYNVRAVRGWDPYLSGLLAWVLSIFLGIPFCISIHADYHKREQLGQNIIPRVFGSLTLTEKLERFLYKKATLVLPIRESLAKLLIKKRCNVEKIRVFPHGIHLTNFQKILSNDYMDKKYRIEKNKKILSVVGRLEKENYIYDYIFIAKELKQKRLDWVLIIAGDGKEREMLGRQIKEYNLEKFVIMPGYLPHREVLDLRVNSYINLCLMAGFSLLEACASGRPVITYDVEWHYELVSNDKTGVIIPEHSLAQAVESIIYLFDHPEIANNLGRAARGLVFNKYDIKKIGEFKNKVYRELLAIKK